MLHVVLMGWYAREICARGHFKCFDRIKLTNISYIHDLFKEKYMKKIMVPELEHLNFDNKEIPRDLNKYVRMNLNILEPFGLDDYFNSDIQLHPLAAVIFLAKEYGITDPQIIYPIAFHSCPIIPIYKKLDSVTNMMIDIVMLADKLSSNHLKIQRGEEVRVDLDRMVFGEDDREFNYSLGLYVARLLSQGDSKEENSIEATKYYYNGLKELNPLIQNEINIKTLGGQRLWPKRKSRL